MVLQFLTLKAAAYEYAQIFSHPEQSMFLLQPNWYRKHLCLFDRVQQFGLEGTEEKLIVLNNIESCQASNCSLRARNCISEVGNQISFSVQQTFYLRHQRFVLLFFCSCNY